MTCAPHSCDDDPTGHGPGVSEGKAELRSFGRRRGRKLSDRQARLLAEASFVDLARPAPASAAALFAHPAAIADVWLEIGFGGAEHLLWQAEHHADVGLLGCEPFEDGVVKALGAVDEKGLGNVLIHPDDARALLRWLPEASIGRAFVLFPDPWPKKRHVKRRLINPQMLGLLARVLRPGAELRIATDIGDYARTILIAVQSDAHFRWTAEGPADWRHRPDDWPGTRYEAKAVREGRASTYLRLVRTS